MESCRIESVRVAKRNGVFWNADFHQNYLTVPNVTEWKKIAVCNFWTGHSTLKLSLKVSIFQLFMNQIIFTPKNIAYGSVHNFAYSCMCCSVSPGLLAVVTGMSVVTVRGQSCLSQ